MCRYGTIETLKDPQECDNWYVYDESDFVLEPYVTCVLEPMHHESTDCTEVELLLPEPHDMMEVQNCITDEDDDGNGNGNGEGPRGGHGNGNDHDTDVTDGGAVQMDVGDDEQQQ